MAMTVVAKPRTDLKRPATAHTEDVVNASTSSQVMSPTGLEARAPRSMQPIPVHTPRTRKKLMGDHDAKQAALLNQTMDEFSSSMNDCISQLTVELERAESDTGAVVTRLRTATEKKHSLRLPSDEVQRLRVEKQRLEAQNELLTKEGELMKQQMMACQTTVQNIRNEACLFRDKMIVDAKTLCQYHVDTVNEIQGKCQGELNQERTRLHKEAQKHQEQLEQELTEYQKSLDKQAEKAVRDRLQQEMDKVKAEMNNVAQTATGSRKKLEQHYKNELVEADKIIQQERVARLERTLEATNAGGSCRKRHRDCQEPQEQVRPGVGRERSCVWTHEGAL
eukprot:1888320-Amphidinium_carterae.1